LKGLKLTKAHFLSTTVLIWKSIIKRQLENPSYLEMKEQISKKPMDQDEITTEFRKYFELIK